MGTGAITCARCLGSGVVMNAAGESAPCPMCNGQCVHSCENCKGRGRFIPTMLDARVSRDPESELEEIGLQ
jgi:DnaJ-class molecular chaperone